MSAITNSCALRDFEIPKATNKQKSSLFICAAFSINCVTWRRVN
jgi:hypothetical protein